MTNEPQRTSAGRLWGPMSSSSLTAHASECWLDRWSIGKITVTLDLYHIYTAELVRVFYIKVCIVFKIVALRWL